MTRSERQRLHLWFFGALAREVNMAPRDLWINDLDVLSLRLMPWYPVVDGWFDQDEQKASASKVSPLV